MTFLAVPRYFAHQLLNMALSAYVLGNITMLTTQLDQSMLDYRSTVSQVAAYLRRKVFCYINSKHLSLPDLPQCLDSRTSSPAMTHFICIGSFLVTSGDAIHPRFTSHLHHPPQATNLRPIIPLGLRHRPLYCLGSGILHED
jgi:hypothetical protein